jgi:hypothetical protein
LVLVFMLPSELFILPLLRIIFLSLRLVLDDVLSVVLRVLFVWSGVPALGWLDGLPVWAPGAVPGATVWAKAALVLSAKAAATIRRDFIRES